MVESKATKRVKVLTYEDFLSITYNEQYLNYYGVKRPEKVEANAEQAVVSAIMNVTDTDPVKVAVLTGYGEKENTVYRICSRQTATLSNRLTLRLPTR